MWCKKVTKQFALITPQPQTTKMFRSLRSFKLSVLMSRSPQCRGLAFVYCSENATTSTTFFFTTALKTPHRCCTSSSKSIYDFTSLVIVIFPRDAADADDECEWTHHTTHAARTALVCTKQPKTAQVLPKQVSSDRIGWLDTTHLIFLFTLIITFYYDRVTRFTCATAFDCLRWRRARFLVWQFPLIFFARLQCEPTRPM